MRDILVKGGRILLDGSFVERDLVISQGKIAESAGAQGEHGQEIILAENCVVLPGFIDVHTHGAVGVDVNHAKAADYQRIADFFATQGTTGFLVSILTDTEEKTMECIDEVRSFMDTQKEGARLLGIHLEGPFLAEAYKGAMPKHLLKDPDCELLKKYQERANGAVRYLTLAPELPHALELVEEAVNLGIVVSMGHSGADYETCMEAVDKGVTSATHTFNAMKLMHQHFPSVMGAAMESDVYCEAICDGRHLHPGVVRLLIKTKGLDKVVAITDSIMAAGLPDGLYKLGANDIVVRDGDAKLTDGITRAGSTLTMLTALKNLMSYTGRPLEEISRLFSENPARMLHLSGSKGSLQEGMDADLVILDSALNLKHVVVQGVLQNLTTKEIELCQ